MKSLGLMAAVLGILSITSAAISKCKLDLGLVVDKTKSIKEENIPKLKAALKHLVQRFDISEDETHVSFATFAKQARLQNTFNNPAYHNVDAMQDLINSSISRLSQPTRLDRAVKLAKEHMFTERNGLRGVRNVLVLYTDGRSHPRDTEMFYLDVVAIKSRGVRVIVVGIGPDARKQKYRQVLVDIAGENLFFVDDYASLDDHTNDIMTLICPPNPCENSKGLDVAFLVDRTRSLTIADFMLAKGFFAELVGALNISRDATHVGIILFARKGKVISTFADEEFYNKEALYRFIENIPDKRFMPTRIDRALIAASNSLFTPVGGDREKFPNVLILLTDGRTHRDSTPFAEIVPSLKAKNVHMVAIGVGQHEKYAGQLEEIAGDNVHTCDSFDQLSDLFTTILAESCSVDGGFSRWGFWSECTVTCGGGTQTRTRTCTHPPPQGPYGADCEGPLEETRACNEKVCS